MAGEWIKMETSLPDKPETLAITAAMGWDDPDLTVGKLMRLFRWFDQQTVDGNAPSVTPALLDRNIGVTGFVQAVANSGWLTIDEAGLRLNNFDRHNGSTAKKRAQTAKRVANFREEAKDLENSNVPSVTSALAREEKRREEVKPKALSGKPDEPALVLAFLNECAGSKYRAVPANLDLIKARLDSGVSVDDCREVITAKAKEWQGDADMEKYLRPSTLFARTNFENYLGALPTGKTPSGAPEYVRLGYGSALEMMRAREAA